MRNLSLSWPHRIVSWRCSQGKLTESIYLFDTEIWKARKYRKTSQIIHWELWWPFLENLEINLRPYKKVRRYFNSQAPELSRDPVSPDRNTIKSKIDLPKNQLFKKKREPEISPGRKLWCNGRLRDNYYGRRLAWWEWKIFLPNLNVGHK